MKLKQIGANQTELILEDGSQVFFSYETPVAVRTESMHCGQNQTRVCVTTTKYSQTTSKHINKWVANYFDVKMNVPQSEIDNFLICLFFFKI